MDITYEKSIFASTDATGTPYITETPYIEPFLAFNGLEERLGNDTQGFYERKQYEHDTKFPILVTQPITMYDTEALKFKPRDIYFRDADYQPEPTGNIEWMSNTELNNLLFNVFSDGTPRYAAKAGPNPEHEREKYMLALQRLDEMLANPDATIANAIGASTQRANLLNKIKLADPTMYAAIQSGENEKRMVALQQEMVSLNSNMLANQSYTLDVNGVENAVEQFLDQYGDDAKQEVPDAVLIRFVKIADDLQKYINDKSLSNIQRNNLINLDKRMEVVFDRLFEQTKKKQVQSLEGEIVFNVNDLIEQHGKLIELNYINNRYLRELRQEHMNELENLQAHAKTDEEKDIIKEMLNELISRPRVPPTYSSIEEKQALAEEEPTEEEQLREIMTKGGTEALRELRKLEEPTAEMMPVIKNIIESKENPLTDAESQKFATLNDTEDIIRFINALDDTNKKIVILELLNKSSVDATFKRNMLQPMIKELRFDKINDKKMQKDVIDAYNRMLENKGFKDIGTEKIKDLLKNFGTKDAKKELYSFLRGAFVDEDVNKFINIIGGKKKIAKELQEFIEGVEANMDTSFVSDDLFNTRFAGIAKTELIRMFKTGIDDYRTAEAAEAAKKPEKKKTLKKSGNKSP